MPLWAEAACRVGVAAGHSRQFTPAPRSHEAGGGGDDDSRRSWRRAERVEAQHRTRRRRGAQDLGGWPHKPPGLDSTQALHGQRNAPPQPPQGVPDASQAGGHRSRPSGTALAACADGVNGRASSYLRHGVRSHREPCASWAHRQTRCACATGQTIRLLRPVARGDASEP
ncbi:uncharacterized protein Tco025E_03698 [Trypanosoma conorhini]|uniref:Uncharacterized protein n=1 Tax=Trypanosoma conorhini TaxID=83891 RepID=A0A422PSI0_9TRYP|nr:uncharacterized protein Tco025E_03698 [Trypanosoma conorhini]RNF20671.1 hypothetical protein Tco025E_03698 [Trypanosoma conorhini]